MKICDTDWSTTTRQVEVESRPSNLSVNLNWYWVSSLNRSESESLQCYGIDYMWLRQVPRICSFIFELKNKSLDFRLFSKYHCICKVRPDPVEYDVALHMMHVIAAVAPAGSRSFLYQMPVCHGSFHVSRNRNNIQTPYRLKTSFNLM